MPVTDATKKSKVFMILGVMDQDNVTVTLGQFSLIGFRSETYDNTALRKVVNDALVATTAAQDGIIDSILTEFDKFFLKETSVIEDNGTRGVLLDIDEKFEIWRKRLASMLGIIIPMGDAVDEIKNRLQFQSGGRIVI